MNLVIILAIVIVVLFAMTYFTKRRFGVLGLALCAGSLISAMWTEQGVEFVRGAGIELLTPPLSSVVASVLVLIPAVLLLFSGPTYHKQWQRLVGSAAFALLAVSFLLTSFGNNLVLDDKGQQIYTFLTTNSTFIVTVGILYALYDVLTHKTPKSKDKV